MQVNAHNSKYIFENEDIMCAYLFDLSKSVIKMVIMIILS